LAAGVIRALEAECGTVDDAVLVVLETPGIGDELDARGVRDLSGFKVDLSGRPQAEVYVPPQHERWVYRRVAEHFGYGHDAGSGAPPLPLGLNWFAHGKIQQAVKLFAAGSTRNDVATSAKLQPKDATRVRNLAAGGLLPLNEQRKLVPDPRVARAKGQIALRYLDESGQRWLDPHDDRPPLARGGSA
jgi:hypothetical protein